MKRFSFNCPLHSIVIILAMHFVFVLSTSAHTISLEEAIAKAQRFLSSNSEDFASQARGTVPTFKLAYEARTTDKSTPCYYVLNHTSPKGYIIVPADDRLPDVLGYSNSGEFDINQIPDNMKWWLSEYERQIEWMLSSANDGTTYATETDYREEWAEIQPLIKTQWNQYAPYNNLCPIINGEKTLTGCVATAMAQIMNYHQWPMTGNGSHGYEWNGQTLSMDFSKVTFDWANMLDVYTDTIPEYYFNETTTNEQQYMTFTGIKQSIERKQYLEVYKFANISTGTLNGDAQLLLMDNYGNFIRPVGEKKSITNLGSMWSYGTYYFKHFIPSDIPDGIYRLYIGFKPYGSNEWSVLQRATDESNIPKSPHEEYYVTIFKTDSYYSIENETFACCYNKVQGEAVATLMYACGISLDMNYGTDGSGAVGNLITKALGQYFGYSNTNSWSRAYAQQLPDWENVIYNELMNGRPIVYGGPGHVFLCDGYSYDGYFHINWGWGGGHDGYFLLDALDPNGTGIGYSSNQSIIYGIRPLRIHHKTKIDGVYYGLVENEAVVLPPDEGYYTGDFVIPEIVTYENETYAVTEVNDVVWSHCQDLTSLIAYPPIYEFKNGNWDREKSPNLKTIILPNVVHFGNWVFGNSCSSLETLQFGPKLESIGYAAFYKCQSLKELAIPDNVKSIGDWAFGQCNTLETLKLGSEVKSIGKYAFYNCKSLKALQLGDELESIGDSAFYYCQNLETLVIPNSVKSIGNQAFYNSNRTCKRTIISRIEDPFDLDNNPFSEIAFANDILYVPYGTIEKYRAREGWKNFVNIIEGEPTSINMPNVGKSDATEKERYMLGGQRSTKPRHGINIIKMSDGTVKKVIVE